MTKLNDVKSWAIVPAAGIGKRMGSFVPKQYAQLSGKSVLEHTLQRLTDTELFEDIVLASQPNDGRAQAIASLFKNVILACGGSERMLTVRNALSELENKAAPDDWVFIHDAARPCVRVEDIHRLHQAIQQDPIGGLLALPMRDTVKLSDTGRSKQTVDRSVLWQALTPQAFRYEILVKAIHQAIAQRLPITDDASALEHLGHQPLLVEGASDNLKITFPEDILLAQTILQIQEKSCA
jgi:2-C-methyl-D-erythritol 4-phosphate cytidylyltransferase